MASYLVIATIDFGTTYSGHAYAYFNDLKKEKASEAEQNYAQLAEDEEHKGWRFFKHFKMMLLKCPKIRRNTRLYDDQGRPMKALNVISAAIRYLKDDVIAILKGKVTQVYDNDIKWVITVPAIWNYKAKQFMIEAAIQAGIEAKHVVLAHEPEAAAIYCKHIEVCRAEDSAGNAILQCFKEGSQFMILDLGGGTVDVTAYEVQADGSLKELCPRGGGPWGGTVVNSYLYTMLENIIGLEVMETFSNDYKCTYDRLKLNETIELRKRATKVQTTDQKNKSTADINGEIVRLELPATLLKFYEEQKQESLSTSLRRCSDYPCMKKDKLCIRKETFFMAFEKPKQKIIEEVRSLEGNFNLKQLKTFMMVGGFSESPIIQQAVRHAFPEKKVLIPENAYTAVLKGAVLYGYQSSYIKSRILPYSFGISTSEMYDETKHHGAVVDNFNKVEDIFCPYVRKGTTVTEKGIDVLKQFGNTSLEVEVFQTPADKLPKLAFTYEEHFERIGKVDIPFSLGNAKTVDVKMTFGVFDIKVSTRPTDSEEWAEKSFDAL
ncbi:Heat shock 70 kDa protein 12A [Mactra antiquata]